MMNKTVINEPLTPATDSLSAYEVSSVGSASVNEQGLDTGRDSDWEDAGQLVVPGVEIKFDDDYMQNVETHMGQSIYLTPEAAHSQISVLADNHAVAVQCSPVRDTESVELRALVMSMEMASRDRELEVENQMKMMREECDEVMRGREQATLMCAEKDATIMQMQEEMALMREELNKARRTEMVSRSLAEQWQAESSAKEMRIQSIEKERDIERTAFHSHLEKYRLLVADSQRRVTEAEGMYRQERQAVERLERCLHETTEGNRELIATIEKIRSMNFVDRLQLAVCITLNQPQGWKVVLGKNAAPLMLTDSSASRQNESVSILSCTDDISSVAH